MTETLVIVQITDGYADTNIVHHPAVEKRVGGEGQIRFTFDQHAWPPAHWPSMCGRVEKGSVYAYAGMLEDAELCADCATLASTVREA